MTDVLHLDYKRLINRCKFGLKRGWFQCWFVFYSPCKTIFDQSSSCWRFSIISLSLFLFRTCRDSWYVRVKQGQRRSVHDKFQLVYAIALTSLLHQPLLPVVSPRPVARECSSDAPVPQTIESLHQETWPWKLFGMQLLDNLVDITTW